MKQTIVLKFIMEDCKTKKRAMKTIAGFEGVDSIVADKEQNQITIKGDVDSVAVTCKLRKIAPTEILSVGPAEEEIEEAQDEVPEEEEEEPEDKKPKEEKEKAEDKELKEGNPVETTPPLTCFHASPIYYSNYHHVRDEYPSSCTIL